MALKSQSALEFMTTYSFSFIIISIALVIGALIASSEGTNLQVFSSCNIQPLLPCQTSVLAYNSSGGYTKFYLLFRNQLSYVLEFPATNSLNLTTINIGRTGKVYTRGNCTPSIAAQGAQILCQATISGNAVPSIGSVTFTPFSLKYVLCTSPTNALTCYPGNYFSTGYASETFGPVTSSVYNFSISSANGVVVINGAPYYDGTTVYTLTGNYNLFAQPNGGHSFIGWSWVGGASSSIATTNSPNAILVLNSNGNVIAYFS